MQHAKSLPKEVLLRNNREEVSEARSHSPDLEAPSANWPIFRYEPILRVLGVDFGGVYHELVVQNQLRLVFIQDGQGQTEHGDLVDWDELVQVSNTKGTTSELMSRLIALGRNPEVLRKRVASRFLGGNRLCK